MGEHKFVFAPIFRLSLVYSKILIKLFQKFAVSKGGAFGRAPQSAKHFSPFLFLQDLPAKQGNVQLFSLAPAGPREKEQANRNDNLHGKTKILINNTKDRESFDPLSLCF